jgi:hypothetical protein
MPSSGITGLYGSSIFSFLRNLHSTFHRSLSNSHFNQHCISVPFSLHPSQHLLLFVFLMTDWSEVESQFHLWPRMISISLYVYWPFVLL